MDAQNKAPSAAPSPISPKHAGPVVLAILDGWGIAPKGPGNAIAQANTPNMHRFAAEFPSTQLMAHGRYVGLLPNQEGNSEAGHTNIGAGRIVRQDIVTVTESIKDHTFFKNTAFKEAIRHVAAHRSTLHVMGMLTADNSAHASPDHLRAVLKLTEDEGVERVRLHLFTDGRDSKPFAARDLMRDLVTRLTSRQRVATVIGRFYAMDRNKFWDRTELAYRCIVEGKGLSAPDPQTAIAQAYERGESDEFIQPTVITEDGGRPYGILQHHDAVIFFNLRSDRARQLAKCFVQREFESKNQNAFTRGVLPDDIRFAAMTDFGPDLDSILTAFPSRDVEHGLTETLHGYRQFYIAESEKYAHVTYFMNGGYADPTRGEQRMRVPSANVKYAKDLPEMRATLITDEVIRRLQTDLHDFVCINYANADMVAHTGDIAATRKAVETVDRELGKLADVVLKKGGHLVVVADHGNAECMLDENTGEVITEHTVNPVPFHIVSERLKDVRVGDGMLGDVAPTLLEIMDIPKPEAMTGFSLIRA